MMNLNDFSLLLQGYLAKPPLIVLGSGASVPYGLPTMTTLAQHLREDETICADPHRDRFHELLADGNLEVAIDQAQLSDATHERIKTLVWQRVNQADLACMRELACGGDLVLSRLFKKILDTSHNSCTVITTNYDRLPEYAADLAGASCVTGFEGRLLRQFASTAHKSHARKARSHDQRVYLWKVHGSLDWFSHRGSCVSYPLSTDILPEHSPLIIPPTQEKYRNTRQAPYHEIIARSDEAFNNASSFLCIGYGFNDEHIQPNLIAQVKDSKPIVVLARTLTPQCRELFLTKENAPRFILIEQESAGRSTIYLKDRGRMEKFSLDGDYWMMDKLLEIW